MRKAASAFQVVTTVMGAAGLVYAGYTCSHCAPGLAPLHQNQHDVMPELVLVRPLGYLLSSPMNTPKGSSEISSP